MAATCPQTQMESLIKQLLTPEGHAMATRTLKTHLKNPENLVLVANCISNSQDQSVRQMACSVLKEKIKTQWPRLQQTQRDTFKDGLLNAVLVESVTTVRSSIALVIGIIAKHELAQNSWPTFMSWIGQCVNSQVVVHREVGLVVLSSICEKMPTLLRPMYADMFQLFHRTLADTDNISIPFHTIEAMTFLVTAFEGDEIQYISPLLDQVVFVIRQLLSTDEDKALKAFDFFDNLFESECMMNSPDMNVGPLIQLFLEVASEKRFENTTRTAVLAHITWLTTNSKKIVLKYVDAILTVVLPIMGEPKEFEDSEDLLDEEDAIPSEYAAHVLDCLSLNFAPSIIVKPCLNMVASCYQSPDQRQRLVAQIALRTITEGCSDYLRAQLESILMYVNAGLEDPEPSIQEAACLTVISFARHLQPEICKYHADIIPRVFKVMECNQKIDLQEKACVALESFCLNLQDELELYLDVIMKKFKEMLHNSTLRIQEVVVYCIGSAAVAAEKKFLPYLPIVYGDLFHLMTIQGEENDGLRANAIDAMGAIIRGLGKEHVDKFIGEVLPVAMDNLKLENPEIDQCTFGLFGSLAAVYGADFAAQLPQVLPHISRVLISDDDVKLIKQADEVDLADSDDEEQWEDDDETALYTINRDSFLAKETALNVLGSFAEYLPHQFYPYLESTIETVLELVTFTFCQDVQKAAMSTLCSYMECLHAVNYGIDVPQTWTPGLPLQAPLPESLAAFSNTVMSKLLPLVIQSDDMHVVGGFFNVIIDPLKKIGPGMLENCAEQWIETLYKIIRGEANCQKVDLDSNDIDNKLTMGEFDVVLIEGACELTVETVKVLGSSFQSYFPMFKEALMKFYQKDSSDAERITSVSALAEMVEALKDVQTHALELYKLFTCALQDEECEVRVSAAFGLGLLCEFGGAEIKQLYPEILQLLNPLFSDNTMPNLPDNAAAALARMMVSAPELVPMEQVLPVFLNALPLKKDFVENANVYRAIYFLFQNQNPQLAAHSANLVPIFAQVLTNVQEQIIEQKKPELLEQVVTIAKHLYQQHPDIWAPYLNQNPFISQYFN